MSYWLLKTEPTVYSFADLVRDAKTVWDGVSNNLALRHIRSMKKGDLAFIYHTGSEKQIVGIAEVSSDPYPDPGRNDPKLVVVDLKPKKALKKPVQLSSIKADKTFSDMPLVRIGRLSVMPVSSGHWKRLLSMSD